MAGIIGTIPIHIWQGSAPPRLRNNVTTIYRPGQSSAAAKIQPNQATEISFQSTTHQPESSAQTYADGFRSLIGATVALTYSGVSYGNVLIGDVQILAIESKIRIAGRHPDGTDYNYSPGASIVARWRLIRLA